MSGISHAGVSSRPVDLVKSRAITSVRGPGSSPGRQPQTVVPESPPAMSGTSHAEASARPVDLVKSRATTTVRDPGSSPGRQPQTVVPESPQAMSGTSHAGVSARPVDLVKSRAITSVRGPGSSPGRRQSGSSCQRTVRGHGAAARTTDAQSQPAATLSAPASRVKSSSPSLAATAMVSPGPNSPDRIFCARAFSNFCWMARLSGRAP